MTSTADLTESTVDSRAESFRLSFAQERLWFLEQLDPGTAQFTISSALHVTGRLDVGHLRAAFAALIDRHEVMRTRFVDRGSGPVQEVLDLIEPPLRVVDLSGRSGADAALREIIAGHSGTGFDLTVAPALRATLVVLGESRSVLLISMHHIVCDGVSAEILLRDLSALYLAAVEGEAAVLPELDIQYGDFAEWQRENVDERLIDEQLGFWSQELRGTDGHLPLPTDRPRPADQDRAGAVTTRTLPAARAAALMALARREGVSPFMLVLAGYELALARVAGLDDFCIGTTVSGRSLEQVTDVFGCFINVIPLRSDVDGSLTFRQLLRRVRERCLRSYANADVPFERIVDRIGPRRDPARSPLFDVMLAVQVGRSTAVEVADCTLRPELLTADTAQYDLALDVQIDDTGVDLALGYATALFDEVTARSTMEQIVDAIEDFLGDPDRLIGDVRQAFAPAGVAVPATGEEHCADVVRRCLGRTDDGRIRAMQGDRLHPGWLLWQTAEATAQALRHRGVPAGSTVGVHLRGGPDVLAASVGGWLAGGCVVQLDPRAQRQSVERLARELGVTVVISDEPDGFDGLALPWSRVTDGDRDGPDATDTPPPSVRTPAVVAEPGAEASTAGDVSASLRDNADRLGLSGSDTVVMEPSSAVVDMLSVLVSGARIAFARAEPAFDRADLSTEIAESPATAAWLPVESWTALLDAGWIAPPGFRVICTAPLPTQLTERLAGHGASIQFLNPGEDPPGDEPTSAVEGVLLECFRRSLARADFGPEDDFFEFGGTSLAAARLVRELGSSAGIQMPVRMLFAHPTVAGLCAALSESAAATGASAVDRARLDQVLPPEIAPAAARRTGQTRRALVTGATGFIGAHLVDRLVADGLDEVVCLVRAADDAEAGERIRTELARYRLDADPLRIRAVAGDLATPRLGLSEERFGELADTMDAIFHSGAVANFGLPYTSLRGPNVDGTVEILRLACTARPSAVHYVSTMDARMGPRLVEEPVPVDAGSDDGYVLSKKVAESLVLEAGRRGLPVGVYRPWLVTSSTRTGATNLHDQFGLCLTASLIAGVVPADLPQPLHLLPVDEVARRIVRLAGTVDPDRPIHQLFNDRQVVLADLHEQLGSLGHQLRVTPFDQWRVQVARRTAGSMDELAALLALDADAGAVEFPSHVDTSNTRRRLGSSEDWPDLDPDYVRRTVEFLVSEGVVPGSLAHAMSGAR